jgi:hypothetical protein
MVKFIVGGRSEEEDEYSMTERVRRIGEDGGRRG